VVLAGAAVIAAGLFLDYRISRERTLEGLRSSAARSTGDAVARIQEITLGVEAVVRVVSESLRAAPGTGQTRELLENIVRSNPHISAAAIAFAPRSGNALSAPYVYRDPRDPQSDLLQLDLAEAETSYVEEDWFQVPRDRGEASWVGPYYEASGIETLISTFGAPLFDDAGEFIAVVTADITLSSLYPYLAALALDSRGFGFLLTREQILIGAPAVAMIAEPLATLFPELAEWQPDGDAPLSLPARCPRDGSRCELRLRSVEGSPWSVGVVYSAEALLQPLRDYALRLALIGLLMLVLLAVMVGLITRRLTQPLVSLAESSRAIARGQLKVGLPEVRRDDEVGDLIRSFDNMRRDLARYIAEVERSAAERSRLEGELSAAAEIQRSMLPEAGQADINAPDLYLWARLRPARAVGGDLYSFSRDEHQLRFAIGDVSDKGIAAALFMARAIALVEQWQASADDVPPQVALAQINDSLCRDNERCMFLTLTLGQLELGSGRLCFSSGGHNAPLRLHDGAVEVIEQERGPALALQDGLEFPGNELTLKRDETLLLYTDGFDEAMDPDGRPWGEDALIEMLRSRDSSAPADIGEALFDAVDDFARGAPQHDDMTLMLVERPGQRLAPQQSDRRSFPLDSDLLGASRAWLEEHARAQGLSGEEIGELRLIAEEMVCNVRDHAGLGPGDELALSLERFDNRVEFSCSDPGNAFDPLDDRHGATLGASIDEAEIGGLGIHLIRQLSDAQSYQRSEGRNILRVVRYREAAGAAGTSKTE
jgi:sigma-B regulation protein RsbU (phosphoserine phosphatase)